MNRTKSSNKKFSGARLPPLDCDEHIEIDQKTGLQVRATHHRRGILAVVTRHYDSVNHATLKNPTNPKVSLEQLCEDLRDYLEARDLPSDRRPYWSRQAKGEWVQVTNFYGHRTAALWSSRVRDLTEPLTPERLAAELLSELSLLLEREGIDKHLWHIRSVMKSYHAFSTARSLNGLAYAGQNARRGRAAGGKAKREKAQRVRDVIREIAKAYWAEHPALLNDASNTAACIADAVNQELRARQLLPKNRTKLAHKTIADHIRSIIK